MSHGKKFYIVSEMNGKVIDIAGGDSDEGTKVIMYRKREHNKKNQLWYFDHDGYIRSALNHMVFHNDVKGEGLKMTSYSGYAGHQWRLSPDEKTIVNGHGHCLDIRGQNKEDKAEVCAYDYGSQCNQHWKLDFDD